MGIKYGSTIPLNNSEKNLYAIQYDIIQFITVHAMPF